MNPRFRDESLRIPGLRCWHIGGILPESCRWNGGFQPWNNKLHAAEIFHSTRNNGDFLAKRKEKLHRNAKLVSQNQEPPQNEFSAETFRRT